MGVGWGGDSALITLMGLISPPSVRSGLVMARCASSSGPCLSAPPTSGQIASKTITARGGQTVARRFTFASVSRAARMRRWRRRRVK